MIVMQDGNGDDINQRTRIKTAKTFNRLEFRINSFIMLRYYVENTRHCPKMAWTKGSLILIDAGYVPNVRRLM